MSDTDKLAIPNKPTFGKKVGLSAKLHEAQNKQPEIFDPLSKTHRLGIVFDDSGSMAGEAIEKAHEAIDLFVKNCNSFDTALALYPLNKDCKGLSNNFAEIAIYGQTIPATGGTPLYTALQRLITEQPITRAVAFSDGSPTDKHFKNDTLNTFIEKKIPIDTIYIGTNDCPKTADDMEIEERFYEYSGYWTMKMIAEKTGGIFLHFTDASVLAKSLKYLAPRFRYMLEDKSVKERVEKGKCNAMYVW
jgi:uncharacterized protein YegL